MKIERSYATHLTKLIIDHKFTKFAISIRNCSATYSRAHNDTPRNNALVKTQKYLSTLPQSTLFYSPRSKKKPKLQSNHRASILSLAISPLYTSLASGDGGGGISRERNEQKNLSLRARRRKKGSENKTRA